MALWQYLWAGSWITKWLYHLDGDAIDASGNGNNWTANNVTWVWGEIWSGAGSFNGTTSKIEITDHSSLKPTWNITISGIIQVSPSASRREIFQSYSQSWTVAWFQVMITQSSWEWWNENKIRFVVWSNTWFSINTQYQQAFSLWIIADWIEHRFKCIYNWSTIQVFVDGKWWNTANYSAWIWYKSTNYIRIWCSNRDATSDEFFSWIIDEVFLENRNWLQSEIIKDYTFSKWRFAIL